jgi:hypothetical protein
MSRILGNWLETYKEYTKETESAPIFHKWVGISILAAALSKKVWLNLGRIKVFPNLYVVLVAEPGIARKSQAITYGVEVMNEIDSIFMSADAITKEALLQDLECAKGTYDDCGVNRGYCALNIVSKEFESFLGQKKENTKMLVLLTDLFDAHEGPWRYRTKGSGNNVINNVFLNVLAATTPESLASSLPSAAIGGGLTSRIIFIWASGGHKKIAYPAFTQKMLDMRVALVHDLAILARTAGNYTFSADARERWEKWYSFYNERNPERICKDPAFHGWYSRKPMFILKIAMILTASKTSSMKLEWKEIYEAVEVIVEAEELMGKTFSAIGRSDVAPDVDLVKTVISQHGSISEKQLLQIVWRDVDSKKFDNVIDTILKSGEAIRSYTGPKGQKGIWYYSPMVYKDTFRKEK